MIKSERIPLGKVKIDRLAARRALYVFLLLLSAVAVYRAIDPPKQIIVERPAQGAPDLPAQLFARDFVTAYLTFDAARPERREAAIARFGADSDFGYKPPSVGARRVRSTAVEQVYPKGDDVFVYVVTAETTAGVMHVSVNVGRDAAGALGVVGFPAIVGAAARGDAISDSSQLSDVDDQTLFTVAQRAMSNWLAHNETDLAADLTPEAKVSLPDQTYELQDLQQLLDARDGSVRATVTAIGQSGEELTLTYELNVEQRADRWMVSAIHTLPDWR